MKHITIQGRRRQGRHRHSSQHEPIPPSVFIAGGIDPVAGRGSGEVHPGPGTVGTEDYDDYRWIDLRRKAAEIEQLRGKLHGLKEPSSQHQGMAKPEEAQRTAPLEPDTEPARRHRRRDKQAEAILRIKIEKVLVKARRKWPDPKRRLGNKTMAKELVRENGKELGYAASTVRQILDGTYPASKRLGFDRL